MRDSCSTKNGHAVHLTEKQHWQQCLAVYENPEALCVFSRCTAIKDVLQIKVVGKSRCLANSRDLQINLVGE
jgi:hypothetical protein